MLVSSSFPIWLRRTSSARRLVQEAGNDEGLGETEMVTDLGLAMSLDGRIQDLLSRIGHRRFAHREARCC